MSQEKIQPRPYLKLLALAAALGLISAAMTFVLMVLVHQGQSLIWDQAAQAVGVSREAFTLAICALGGLLAAFITSPFGGALLGLVSARAGAGYAWSLFPSLVTSAFATIAFVLLSGSFFGVLYQFPDYQPQVSDLLLAIPLGLVGALAACPQIAVVATAGDGLSAVQQIAPRQPRLLIIDSNLLDEEIAALLGAVKAKQPPVYCLVFVKSTHQDLRLLAAGADALAHRDWSTHELHAALAQVAQSPGCA
jgi:CheY-like chemotaxis protein